MLGSRRVVVTGIGLVTPLGCGNLNVWGELIEGRTGVENIQQFHPDIPITVAAKVKDFDVQELFGKQSCRYRSLATHYALHASDLALQDAGFNGGTDIDLNRAGVAVASGMGSMLDICEGSRVYDTSQRKLSPFFVSKILISSTAGEVSIRNGLKGPNHAVATACAASAHAIGDAYNFIRLGYADFMVAGGAEACLDPLTVAGFAKMRALTKNTDPLTASTPFDEKRSGFVIGEGSGMLILETLESAQKRNATIIAEMVGYGMSGDAHHITSPPEDGNGAYRAMTLALQDAGLSSDHIGYINAHATSTPTGDLAEMNAIHSLFATPQQLVHTHSHSHTHEQDTEEETEQEEGEETPGTGVGQVCVSSTKGATGHLLGAAGAVEAAFACLSLLTDTLPPTLNLHHPVSPTASATASMSGRGRDSSRSDDNDDGGNNGSTDYINSGRLRRVHHVANKAMHLERNTAARKEISYAMTNSFGFGGTNASLIFKKYTDNSDS